MEPITTIATAIAAGKSLVEITKQISGSINKKDNPELLDAVFDMRAKALELQEIIMALRNENEELRKEIKRLNDVSDLEDRLERYEGKTYLTLQNDDGTKRYICSTCWEKNQQTISLKLENDGDYICPECGNGGIYDEEKHKKAFSPGVSGVINTSNW